MDVCIHIIDQITIMGEVMDTDMAIHTMDVITTTGAAIEEDAGKTLSSIN